MQTALTVALACRENQVQLIIGKEHWSDLIYTVNHNADVRIRLIPYPCEEAGAENLLAASRAGLLWRVLRLSVRVA